MAYLIFGVVGVFYAMILEAVSKEYSKYISLVIGLLLTLVAMAVNWHDSLVTNVLNGIGFLIWFCSVVAAIFFTSVCKVKLKRPETIIMGVGAISWSLWSKLPASLGATLGV